MIREVAGHIGTGFLRHGIWRKAFSLGDRGWAAGTKTVAVFGIEIPLVANRLTRFHQDARALAHPAIEKLHA